MQRFREPAEVQSLGMLLVALGGLAVNAASMRILRGRGEGSLNLNGAYLEVWANLLDSLGVVATALVIRFTGWSWVDPLVGVAIGF